MCLVVGSTCSQHWGWETNPKAIFFVLFTLIRSETSQWLKSIYCSGRQDLNSPTLIIENLKMTLPAYSSQGTQVLPGEMKQWLKWLGDHDIQNILQSLSSATSRATGSRSGVKCCSSEGFWGAARECEVLQTFFINYLFRKTWGYFLL